MRQTAAIFLTGSLLAISLGCSSQRGPTAPDLAAQANQRLQGSWVLVEFRPEARLEPMLDALLRTQFGNLVLEFDGRTMTATGPGVETSRSYRIIDAHYDDLKVVLTDEQGISYSAAGRFVDRRLEFHVLEAPWRGQGVLSRL